MKGQQGEKVNLWDKLEQGVSIETGKRLFYQLTDEEGGSIPGVDGLPARKCLAFIDYEYKDGRRGPTGSLLVSLTIFRPVHKGGVFQRSEVEFTSSREPGTCSTIQNEDLGE